MTPSAHLVADRLSERYDNAPHVAIISRHVLTAELAESLDDATLVIFVDAAADGDEGRVSVRPLRPRQDTAGAMTHTLDAEALLGWTLGLYGRYPQTLLVSTRGATFDYANDQLSPVVQAAVEPMVRQTQDLIEQHLAGQPNPS